MADLRRIRPRFYSTISILMVVDIALALFLFSPLRLSSAQQERALAAARASLAAKRKEVGPLLGMEQKLKRSQAEVQTFERNRLPQHDSQIAAELGKIAQQSGVRLAGARYQQKASALPDLTEVTIQAGLEGDYVSTIRFINALERDKMFFVLNGVQLSEERGGTVRLSMSLQTLLKA
jgi:hypothetical protein